MKNLMGSPNKTTKNLKNDSAAWEKSVDRADCELPSLSMPASPNVAEVERGLKSPTLQQVLEQLAHHFTEVQHIQNEMQRLAIEFVRLQQEQVDLCMDVRRHHEASSRRWDEFRRRWNNFRRDWEPAHPEGEEPQFSPHVDEETEIPDWQKEGWKGREVESKREGSRAEGKNGGGGTGEEKQTGEEGERKAKSEEEGNEREKGRECAGATGKNARIRRSNARDICYNTDLSQFRLEIWGDIFLHKCYFVDTSVKVTNHAKRISQISAFGNKLRHTMPGKITYFRRQGEAFEEAEKDVLTKALHRFEQEQECIRKAWQEMFRVNRQYRDGVAAFNTVWNAYRDGFQRVVEQVKEDPPPIRRPQRKKKKAAKRKGRF